MDEEFTTIALVRKTQGRRGEVAAELHTDFPELFAERRKILLLARDGQRTELELESFWFHKDRIILKFVGIDSISEAEKLMGGELQIPTSQRAPLEPGAVYVSDLVGSIVYDSDRLIGRVKRVEFSAGEAPLLVVGSEADQHRLTSEYAIPFAQAYLQSWDVEGKQIHMLLPEGMLDLNVSDKSLRKQRRRRSERALEGKRKA